MLFDIGSGLHFMYQGIFDTDFDKYTEDAVELFAQTGINTVFNNLEGFPEDWKENPEAFMKFVREHQCPSFLEYGEYPYVTRRRDQEGARAEGGLLGHARPDAVDAQARGFMLELDDIQHILLTRTPALAGRYEFLTFDTPEGGRAWLAALIDLSQSAADAQATMDDSRRWVTWRSPGTGCGRSASTRSRWPPSPTNSARAWPPGRRSSATRAAIIPTTGSAAWQATTSTPS